MEAVAIQRSSPISIRRQERPHSPTAIYIMDR